MTKTPLEFQWSKKRLVNLVGNMYQDLSSKKINSFSKRKLISLIKKKNKHIISMNRCPKCGSILFEDPYTGKYFCPKCGWQE